MSHACVAAWCRHVSLQRVYRYSPTAAPPCAEMTQPQQLFKYQQVGGREGGGTFLFVMRLPAQKWLNKEAATTVLLCYSYTSLCSQQGKLFVKSFSSVVIL
jgi:hypothetical protein